MAFAATIRPATPDDLDVLAQVRATAWREAYTGLLPEPVIAAQWERIPRAIELWQRALDAGETVWLGLLDGEIVGCGALHVLWADLGEVRTVAAHPKMRGMGVRRITISTSGVADGIRRLADEGLDIYLCLSLHAPTMKSVRA